MIISNTFLDDVLKNLLQKKVAFELDKKVFKTGKILLYSQKYFFISFVLSTNKKNKEKLDLPIPFNVEVHKDDNLIYFDYRLTALAVNNKEAHEDIQNISTNKKNKFLDKIVTISVCNE